MQEARLFHWEVGLGLNMALLGPLLLWVGGARLLWVGDGLVQVQGGAQREGLVTAVAHKAVELADAAPQVRLAPHLVKETGAVTVRGGTGSWRGHQ